MSSVGSMMALTSTVSGGGAGLPVQYTYHGNASDLGGGPTYTFSTPSSVPSNCLLVVCCGHEDSGNINSLSGGGYTWTKVSSVTRNNDGVAMFAAQVTTPPSSVTLSCSQGGFRANAAFYSMINHTSVTPASNTYSAGSSSALAFSLPNVAGGDAILAYSMHENGGTISFTHGVTGDYSVAPSGNSTFAAGSTYVSAGTTSQYIRSSFGSSGDMILLAAAWR